MKRSHPWGARSSYTAKANQTIKLHWNLLHFTVMYYTSLALHPSKLDCTLHFTWLHLVCGSQGEGGHCAAVWHPQGDGQLARHCHSSVLSTFIRSLVITSHLFSLLAVCPCTCQSLDIQINLNIKRNLESSFCVNSLPITVRLLTDNRHIMSWTQDLSLLQPPVLSPRPLVLSPQPPVLSPRPPCLGDGCPADYSLNMRTAPQQKSR